MPAVIIAQFRVCAMCAALLDYSAETGLHGGAFWVTVFHEYAARGGPVRERSRQP